VTAVDAGNDVRRGVVELPGFALGDVLGRGAGSTVYRGVRDGSEFAIKILHRTSFANDAEASLRFRREAAAIARVNHASVVKIVEANEDAGQRYLVMELVQGDSLRQVLERGALDEARLITLAKSLAAGLGEIHRCGLVHRDIKPANIIVLPSGGGKIIDFGFATQAEERIDPERQVVGTFLYGAPEQTAMLRRAVDGRADLYALGAVLFECATGRPPFVAKNAGELLRMHMSAPVPNAHEQNAQVRPLVADIVAKLLAKDPDDRYRTAEGLLYDLEHLADLDARRSSGSVVLGEKDSHVRISEVPLVGRTVELRSLQARWQQAATGRGGVVQVEGEGGSGKSRLVRELTELARFSNAAVLSGKANQAERIPLGPLREAVEGVLARALRGSDEQKKQTTAMLRRAAGEFASIVRRLSPSLQHAFANEPEIRPLEPAAEQARFYDKVAEFLIALARELGTVLLVIDDVQWIDDGTFEVLRRAAKLVDQVPMLIATTARNDAASEPNRDKLVKALGDALTERIVLSPLDTAAVKQLIAAHLGGRSLQNDFAEKIAVRANGNPFAVGEYVRALAEKGLLRPAADAWVVDEARLHELTLPTDVLQLVIDRLGGLGRDTLEVLSCAAVIGFEFEVDALIGALPGRKEHVHAALEEALRAGLIEWSGERYRFFHDRVYEALLKRLSEEELRHLNQAIAEWLDRRGDGASSSEAAFALARHYGRGAVARSLKRVHETNLAAGIKALEDFSNAAAFEFLTCAFETSTQLGLSSAATSAVRELLGLACTRTGRLPLALEHFTAALNDAKAPMDLARLRLLAGYAYSSAGKIADAMPQFMAALTALGAGLPEKLWRKRLLARGYGWAFRVRSRLGWGFGKLPEKERPRHEALAQVYAAMRALPYFMAQPLLAAEVTLRELYNGFFLGTSSFYAKAHVYHAFYPLSISGDLARVRRFVARGRTMAQQIGDPEASAFCDFYGGLAIEMAGDIVGAKKIWQAEDTASRVAKYCPAQDVAAMIGSYETQPFAQGRSRECVEIILANLSNLNKTGSINFQVLAFCHLYSCYSLLGRTADALKAKDQAQRLFELIPGMPHAHWNTLGNHILVLLDQEELGPELDDCIEKFLAKPPNDYHRRYIFFLVAYARLEQLARAKGVGAREKARQQLDGALAMADERCTTAVHRCHVFVAKAGLAREEGDLDRASKLLDEAEVFVEAADTVWGKWAVERERARIADKAGNATAAKAHAEEALLIAKREGWRNRTAQIERAFRLGAAPSGPQSLPAKQVGTLSVGSVMSTQGRSARLLEKERYVDAILQVAVASSSTLEPKVQARAALEKLMEVLGAERAAVFAMDDASAELQPLAILDSQRNQLETLTGYSTTVVKKVHETRAPLIVTGTEEGEALGSESAVTHNLRSIIAAPLLLGDRFLGIVYLDSRVVKGLFDQDDVKLLASICSFMAVAMDTARTGRLEAQRQSLEKDLELTAAVQSFFLPEATFHARPATRVQAFYRAASHCSGDWWWYDADDGAINVLLGDVTGHGPAPAMLTASAASFYRAWRWNNQGPQRAAAELLGDLNVALKSIARGSYTMTLSKVRVDEADGKLVWWNMGAPPLLVLGANKKVDVLAQPGPPLGGAGEFTLKPAERKLNPGDRVFLFTDGIIEQQLANSRAFGLKGIARVLSQTQGLDVDKAAQFIVTELDRARGQVPQDDDVTFVLIDYAGTN
jgi:serine/threonine protein kinase/serine phosphatase RsbU (regulator of sigma subunit)/tetratricopeptide (TPR) repeat protein